jgi:hypothetical protein
VSGETFPHLERLHLRMCGLGDRGAALLAQHRAAQPLRHLDLRNNQITEPGARALAESEHLERLELLDLRGNRLDDATRLMLSDRFDHDDCRLLLDGEGQP